MFIETFFQDLRTGARVLVKEKSFCVLATLSVAIGVGAVTALFAFVNGALLRSFPFPGADRLVDVRFSDPNSILPRPSDYTTTMADFADLQAAQKSFGAFVAYQNGVTVNATCNTLAERLEGSYVSHDFFHALGVAPALGRDFRSEEDRPHAAKVVVISDSLWRSGFGANPQIIGQTFRLNGTPATIVGVMPAGFSFPRREQLWIPIKAEIPPLPRPDHDAPRIRIIARLLPGVSLAQANLEVAGIARAIASQYPEGHAGNLGAVYPLAQALISPGLRELVWSVLGFSVAVLLIACFNVTNMQFARATLRVKELAVRSALGGTRGRLVRQMLTESLVLSVLGSALGVACAIWASNRLNSELHSFRYPLPSWMVFSVDGRVLGLAVALTGLATIGIGLLPALVASRPNLTVLLKEAGRGSTGRMIPSVIRALVVAQIAVSCVLLIGSLLKAQDIRRGQNIDYGYDTESVLAASLNLMAPDYPTNESRVHFYERLLRSLRSIPAIEAAALTSRFQMVFAGWGERIEIDGRRYYDDRDRSVTQFERVSDGYWAMTGQRLVDGRDFTLQDNDVRQPVALVNETFARKHFPSTSPVGHRFRIVRNDGRAADVWRTIVGVVTDVRMLVPDNVKSDNAGVYLPFNASFFSAGSSIINGPDLATVVIKLRGAMRPESFATELRGVVSRVDPNLPLYFVGTPKTNLAIVFSLERTLAQLFTLCAGVALLLTAIGVYGIASFSVNQRIPEFGIRVALGADRRHLLSLVFAEGARLLGVGLGIGLLAALGLSFAVDAGMPGIDLARIGPRDPVTYVAVAILFVTVAGLAQFGPAWRAARVDPMITLRTD